MGSLAILVSGFVRHGHGKKCLRRFWRFGVFDGRLTPKAWNTGEEYRGAEQAALLMCRRVKKSAKNFNQNNDLGHFRKLHSVAQKFFKK